MNHKLTQTITPSPSIYYNTSSHTYTIYNDRFSEKKIVLLHKLQLGKKLVFTEFLKKIHIFYLIHLSFIKVVTKNKRFN